MPIFLVQVYIVAVGRESRVEEMIRSTEDEELDSSGESLLTLVQSELPTLSQNWFLALKDHALLSLPPGRSHPLTELVPGSQGPCPPLTATW